MKSEVVRSSEHRGCPAQAVFPCWVQQAEVGLGRGHDRAPVKKDWQGDGLREGAVVVQGEAEAC